MKTLDKSLVLLLTLGLAAACTESQQDRAEEAVPSTEEVGQAVDRTAQEFTTEAREAMNELEQAFQELQTGNAELQGESAAMWAEAQQEITQVRQDIQDDMDRLGTAAADDAQQIRARIARRGSCARCRVTGTRPRSPSPAAAAPTG
jgi:ElaB/YqjD/DUF883 family membrane-anchored ribosome-binding protein